MTATQLNRYSDGLVSNGNHLAMTSISLDVADLLAAPDLRARVESVFAKACNLVTDTGPVSYTHLDVYKRQNDG